MCGIAGFIQAQGPCDEAIVAKQLSLLAHRGPDSSGFSADHRAVIGQTRLAVIDLHTGDPPLTNENGHVAVALNGEIYNYSKLRDDLEKRGHGFRSRGDTEVIAHLAEELRPVELAQALDGMFAIAVWDVDKESLALVRDRVGKKPLYYWSDSGTFAFASEIKALLTHPAVTRSLDSKAIEPYLTLGYVPSPRTFFEGIYSVPPGHVLEVTPGGGAILTPYWKPQIPGSTTVEEVATPFEESAIRVRSLLKKAVEHRMISDVPLGAFLSGGIDSSAIVALMSESASGPVRTFTIGFEDRSYDERRYAQVVADRFSTDHTEFVVSPQAVDLVERLVWHHDQPFGDSSAIPMFLLSELTREQVTVALSGDGGDEIFAGYERFIAGRATSRLARLPTSVVRGATRAVNAMPTGLLRGRAGHVKRFFARVQAGLPDAFLAWISYATPEQVAALAPPSSRWGQEDYRRVWAGSEGAATLARLIDLNLRTYLLDDLLPKIDRTSMAHGLEVRSPFLDRELIEFALRLPGPYLSRGFTLKRILKAALQRDLPKEVLARKKQGFGVPLDRWFRADLASYVDSMLTSRSARVGDYLDHDAVEGYVRSHIEGRAQNGHLLWTLLTLEVFLRREGW